MISYSAFISESQTSHNFKNALFIHEYELNELGNSTLQLLSEHKQLADIHIRTSWLVQAIWEFQDLQGGQVFLDDVWLKQGYCFFEAINTLRETILSGVNSFYHVSISGLRSSFELMILHLYWESKKDQKNNLNQFKQWINGTEKKPAFSNLVTHITGLYNKPEDWELKKKIMDVYKKLCSYAHTPILGESFTHIKNTNSSILNSESLKYWLELLEDTLASMLHLLIMVYPISLFPVNIVRKFGFNPPIGVFFDRYNSYSLQHALGLDHWDKYRAWFYANNQNIESLLDWYNSCSDLSLEQIKESWNREDRHKKEYKKLKRITQIDDPELDSLLYLIKVRVRTIQMKFIYSWDLP